MKQHELLLSLVPLLLVVAVATSITGICTATATATATVPATATAIATSTHAFFSSPRQYCSQSLARPYASFKIGYAVFV